MGTARSQVKFKAISIKKLQVSKSIRWSNYWPTRSMSKVRSNLTKLCWIEWLQRLKLTHSLLNNPKFDILRLIFLIYRWISIGFHWSVLLKCRKIGQTKLISDLKLPASFHQVYPSIRRGTHKTWWIKSIKNEFFLAFNLFNKNEPLTQI